MADLAAVVIGAGVKFAVQHQSCAHTRPKGQEDHVAGAAAGAIFPFRERAGVGVVLQGGADACGLFDQLHDRDVVPAGEVGWRLHDAGLAVQGTAAGNADGFRVAGVQTMPGSHGFHLRENAGERLVHLRGFETDLVGDLQTTVGINSVDDGTFRSADIDA